MILHAENRFLFVAESFNGLVIQVDPVHFDIRGQRAGINGEAVVLAGDFHPAGIEVLDRLVASAMAKLEFERLTPQRLAQNLVPEANSEDRDTRLDEVMHRLDGVAERRGVARAVGKKHPCGPVFQSLRGGGGGGNHLHAETLLPQPAQDVVFHPEIIGDDGNIGGRQGIADIPGVSGGGALDQVEAGALLVLLVPDKSLFVGDLLDVIDAHQTRAIL